MKKERGRPPKVDKEARDKSHTPQAEGGKTKKHQGKVQYSSVLTFPNIHDIHANATLTIC